MNKGYRELGWRKPIPELVGEQDCERSEVVGCSFSGLRREVPALENLSIYLYVEYVKP